ncbi:MAG: DUF1232 domain-containing protein [Deltaproteobacteria bacterium]
MIRAFKSKLHPFISEALAASDSILQDREKLRELIGTASVKMASCSNKIKSVKNDLSTLLDLIKAWARGSYTQMPWSTLLLSTGAVIYFINPFDAIPDILPAAGLVDDATVIGFVAASVKEDIERFKQWQSSGDSPPDPATA